MSCVMMIVEGAVCVCVCVCMDGMKVCVCNSERINETTISLYNHGNIEYCNTVSSEGTTQIGSKVGPD